MMPLKVRAVMCLHIFDFLYFEHARVQTQRYVERQVDKVAQISPDVPNISIFLPVVHSA